MFKFKFRKNRTQKIPVCPSGIYWVIGPGDTLALISEKLNIPLEKLMAANPGIDPMNLQIDGKICIPSPEPPQ